MLYLGVLLILICIHYNRRDLLRCCFSHIWVYSFLLCLFVSSREWIDVCELPLHHPSLSHTHTCTFIRFVLLFIKRFLSKFCPFLPLNVLVFHSVAFITGNSHFPSIQTDLIRIIATGHTIKSTMNSFKTIKWRSTSSIEQLEVW